MSGYTSIVNLISAFLAMEDGPLTSPALDRLMECVEHDDYFFCTGGKLEDALHAIIDSANESSVLASLLEDEQLGRAYALLPDCANDQEFSLVRKLLGHNLTLMLGPYLPASVWFGFNAEYQGFR